MNHQTSSLPVDFCKEFFRCASTIGAGGINNIMTVGLESVENCVGIFDICHSDTLKAGCAKGHGPENDWKCAFRRRRHVERVASVGFLTDMEVFLRYQWMPVDILLKESFLQQFCTTCREAKCRTPPSSKGTEGPQSLMVGF